MKGERVIVPSSMQKGSLNQIHAGHQGVVKCQLRAKSCIYWPGINKDIEQLVSRCSICQEHQRSQASEPLSPHDIPQRPWQTLGTDLFHFEGSEYLIVADYYSKFPIVRKINGHTMSANIITLLKQIFSEQGIPTKVVSDNGPQYSSAEFKTFAEAWNFDHVTSSPRYPQSNGFIESTIKTVKLTPMKAKQGKLDPYMALLCLRTTPVDGIIPSPAELLNGRKMRSKLPVKIAHDRPNKDEIHDRLAHRQNQQKKYHDQGTRELSPLLRGQRVSVEDQITGKWAPAIIKDICPEPRSYLIETPNGNTYRRNRRHLRDCTIAPPHRISTTESAKKPKAVVVNQPSGNTLYHTRSGRLSKPPQRYVDEL